MAASITMADCAVFDRPVMPCPGFEMPYARLISIKCHIFGSSGRPTPSTSAVLFIAIIGIFRKAVFHIRQHTEAEGWRRAEKVDPQPT
jgi:hypothetical protein